MIVLDIDTFSERVIENAVRYGIKDFVDIFNMNVMDIFLNFNLL